VSQTLTFAGGSSAAAPAPPPTFGWLQNADPNPPLPRPRAYCPDLGWQPLTPGLDPSVFALWPWPEPAPRYQRPRVEPDCAWGVLTDLPANSQKPIKVQDPGQPRYQRPRAEPDCAWAVSTPQPATAQMPVYVQDPGQPRYQRPRAEPDLSWGVLTDLPPNGQKPIKVQEPSAPAYQRPQTAPSDWWHSFADPLNPPPTLAWLQEPPPLRYPPRPTVAPHLFWQPNTPGTVPPDPTQMALWPEVAPRRPTPSAVRLGESVYVPQEPEILGYAAAQLLDLALRPVSPSTPYNTSHPLARGLQAWWLALPMRFGGLTWYDLASPGNPGTLVNSSSTQGWRPSLRPGGFGCGLWWASAGTQAVTVPDNAALNFGSGSFTLSAWVQGTLASKIIVAKQPSSSGLGYSLQCNATPKSQFQVSDGTNTATATGVTIVDGAWHHVVGVVDRGAQTIAVYTDGVRSTTANASSVGSVTTTNQLAIGRNSFNTNNSWSGFIDDVRLWNRALGQAEINLLRLNSLAGYPGLVHRALLF
jgi:hypothetical protein